MRRIGRFAPIIILLLFVGAAIIYSENLKTRVAVGAPAPHFELPLLDGGTVNSEQFAGEPAYVNFWAAWCPPCLDEMPAHDEFFKRFGDRISYVAVNERETVARIERHLREVDELGLTMDFPIALDRRGEVADTYRIGGLPETWLVDGEGVARQHWVGPATFEQLVDGYRLATGRPIDEADGGPFHGTAHARTVLAEDAALQRIYIGGKGGVARYDLAAGAGAAGDAFEWVPVEAEDVRVMLTRNDIGVVGDGLPRGLAIDGATVGDEVLVIGEKGLPGLPGGPTNVGVASDGTLLAWVPGHGLFAHLGSAEGAGDDGGWQSLTADLPVEMPYAGLAPSQFTKDYWVAATAAGLFESRDGGHSWRATGFQQRSFAASFDPTVPRRLYVAAHDGVWVSDDGGRTARRLPASPQRTLVALHVLPGADAAVIVAAAPNGDVYASRDGGARWEALIPHRVIDL